MQSHKQSMLDDLSCPFALNFKEIVWDENIQILSIDDRLRNIIIKTQEGKYLVDLPHILFDAIYKSGEKNVMDVDLGFNELF